MAYVPVPKDLSKVKTKVAFNLTKRQIVCFAVALLLGLPLFFLLKDSTGTSLASMAMIAVMLPCFLFAMYEKHGQPLEVVVKNIIQTKFIAPKERPFPGSCLFLSGRMQFSLPMSWCYPPFFGASIAQLYYYFQATLYHFSATFPQ